MQQRNDERCGTLTEVLLVRKEPLKARTTSDCGSKKKLLLSTHTLISPSPPPPSTQQPPPPQTQALVPPTPAVQDGEPTRMAIDALQRGSDAYTPAPKRVKRKSAKERDVREKNMMDVIGQIIQEAQSSRRNTRIVEEPEQVEETDWMLECQAMSRFG
eukprot:scaffold67576_cov47-Cyclotella_meneghiniana.AAC.2